MKALEKIREVSRKLESFGIEHAAKEAELIVTECLSIDLTELFKNNPEVNGTSAEAVNAIVARRRGREPLQYITGNIEFMGLHLNVGTGVLIPRPETELMAEYAIDVIRGEIAARRQGENETGRGIRMLDLCSGSGCLTLSLARAFPGSAMYGVDISEKAIAYGEKNAQRNGIENITLLKGDLFAPLGNEQPFDCIISNPPYIRHDDITGLQPEVRDWEPLSALDGGPDGLDYYRVIIPGARKFLNDSGILMLELGAGCSEAAVSFLQEAGYSGINIRKDYSGIDRIVKAKWTR